MFARLREGKAQLASAQREGKTKKHCPRQSPSTHRPPPCLPPRASRLATPIAHDMLVRERRQSDTRAERSTAWFGLLRWSALSHLRVGGVLERVIDLLQRNRVTRPLVHSLPHDAVRLREARTHKSRSAASRQRQAALQWAPSASARPPKPARHSTHASWIRRALRTPFPSLVCALYLRRTWASISSVITRLPAWACPVNERPSTRQAHGRRRWRGEAVF